MSCRGQGEKGVQRWGHPERGTKERPRDEERTGQSVKAGDCVHSRLGSWVPGGTVLQRLPCQHTGRSCPPSQGKRLCCPGPQPGPPSPAGRQRLPGDWNQLRVGPQGSQAPGFPPRGHLGGVMPQQLILGTSAAPHPSCIPQAENRGGGPAFEPHARQCLCSLLAALHRWTRGVTLGSDPAGLADSATVSSSFTEQWFFEHTARGHSLAGTGWLEACGLTVSRQMTDKAQDSSPSPGGGGALTPSDPSAGGPLGMEGSQGERGSAPSFGSGGLVSLRVLAWR